MGHIVDSGVVKHAPNWRTAVHREPLYDQTEQGASVRWLVVIAAAFAVSSAVVRWWFNPDFWLDEAMLAVNLPRVPWSQLHQPLPYFEQAAPLGFLYLAKLFGEATNYSQMGLRSLLLVVTLSALVLLFQATRRMLGSTVAIVATTAVALSPSAIEYSVQFKQYALEMAVAIALLALVLSIHHVGLSRRRVAAWFVAGCVATVFSNTAPLIVAIGFASLLIEGLRSRVSRMAIAVALAAVAYGVLAAGYYFEILAPAAQYQFMGYAHIYEPGYAAFPPNVRWLFGKAVAISTGLFGARDPFMVRIAAGALILIGAAVGVLIAARRAWPLAIHVIALASLIVVLSMLHKLPILEYRHFLFVLPFLAIVIAISMSAAFNVLRRRFPERFTTRTAHALIMVLIVALGIRAIVFAVAHAEREEVTPLLKIVDSEPPRPLWVHVAAQPAIEYLNHAQQGPPRVYIGKLAHESAVPGFMWRTRWNVDEYLTAIDQVAAQHPRLWLLFSHASEETISTVVSRFGNHLGCEAVSETIGAALYKCEAGVASP